MLSLSSFLKAHQTRHFSAKSRHGPGPGDELNITITFTPGKLVDHVNSSVMSCHVMSCRVVSCRVVSCHFMSCHVMSCHVMSSQVKSSHVMSCHVMSCHALWSGVVCECNVIVFTMKVHVLKNNNLQFYSLVYC